MLKLGVLFLFFVSSVYTQKPSPCPKIFTYETKGTGSDRWYGIIDIVSNKNYNGIWLRITLDKSAELLGNWFGEVKSEQSKDYLIEKPKHRLRAGQSLSVRFFVKFNKGSSIPSLKSIRLNGKIICNETFQAQLTTSNLDINQPNSATTLRPIARVTEETLVNNQENVNSNERNQLNGNLGNQAKPSIRPYQQYPLPKAAIGCGTIAMKAAPLISKGRPTSEGQWPWHVALYFIENIGDNNYICGGTLISEDHVITAAHCVAKPRTKRPISTKQLLIHLGKHSLTSVTNAKVKAVSKIIIHREYVPVKLEHDTAAQYEHDIAVIRLETPVEFTNFIRPCCLWDESNAVELLYNKVGTVVGWGFNENFELSDKLLLTEMPVVPSTTCIFSNRQVFSQLVTDTNFCAGFKNGSSPCTGDSGGGMVFAKPGTSGAHTVWRLRGIVSVGAASLGQNCDTKQYIIFTDVAKHLEWIESVISNDDD